MLVTRTWEAEARAQRTRSGLTTQKPIWRLRLEVSRRNFPRFDRNPNRGKPFGTGTELLSARQTVGYDREHASRLVLPLIPH